MIAAILLVTVALLWGVSFALNVKIYKQERETVKRRLDALSDCKISD